MRRVVWARRAANDLKNIKAHIADASPRAAERIIDRPEAAAKGLADFPERGRHLRGALRELTLVRPYRIIYRVGDAVVEVLHIRHSARRPVACRPKAKGPGSLRGLR